MELLSLDEEVFKVIANQKRLEIILLLENGELNVNQMVAMLGLRQANLSQHLTLLRQQRIVTVRRRGRESYYSLTDASVAGAIRLVHDFVREQYHVDTPIDKKSLFPIVTDPVCGMRFSASRAVEHCTVNEATHYFCASGCKQVFLSQQTQQIAAIGKKEPATTHA